MKKGLLITLGIAAVLGLAVAAFFLFLGNKRDAIVKTIPENSIVVSRVSLLDIGRKLDFEKLKTSKIAQLFKEQSDEKTGQMLNGNSGAMGLDFLAPVYLYAYTRADDNKGDDPMLGVTFGISDEEEFRKTLRSTGIMEKDPPASADFNYIRPDGDAILAWTNDIALLLLCDGCRDNTLISEASRLLKLEEKETIVSNDEFNSFDSNTADVNLFLNKPVLQRFLGRQTQILRTKSARDAFATLPTGLTLLFEEDALVLQSYADSDSETGVKAFQSSGLSDKDLALISDQSPIGFLSMNFNMEEIMKTIRESENAELEFTEETLRGLGLSLEELGKMLKGNFSLALTSVPSKEDARSGQTLPVYTFHAGIADPGVFERLMSNFSSRFEIAGKVWILPSGNIREPLGYLLQQDGELVITNDLSALNKFQAGQVWGKINDDSGGADASEHPVCLFMDYTKLLDLFSEEYGIVNSYNAGYIRDIMNEMKSFSLTGDNQQFRMELKFNPTNTSALMHLFSMAERVAISQMGSSEDSASDWTQSQEYAADSVAVMDTTAITDF